MSITNKTRVVFISYNNGRVYRGGEIFVDELAKRLSKIGNDVWVIQGSKATKSHDYHIIHIRTNPNWKGRDFTDTLKRKLFIDKRSLAIAKFTIQSLSRLTDINPDVVFPINGGWQSIILRLWCLVFRKKILFASVSGKSEESNLDLLLFPSAFVALGNDIRLWAKRVNPYIKNIVTIPNGVDLSLFKPNGEKAELNLLQPVILGVGAMSKQKRWPLLIEAIERCTTPCSLLLIGSGPEEEEIKLLGKKELGNHRFFHIQRVEPKEMPKYYRACDLLGFPSDSTEAQGIVCLEAMASGLPVVTTNDEQRRELIGNAGILADPTKVDQFSTAIQAAIHRTWKDLPENQAKKYSWNKIAQLYFRLISDIVSRNGTKESKANG